MKKFFLCLIILLLFSGLSHAANELYIDIGTAVVWQNTGGNEILDLGGTLCGDATVVCVGAYHDWGVDPRPGLYMMEVFIDGYGTAPAAGQVVEVYITEGETTSVFSGPESPVDGDPSDAIGDVNRLANLLGPFPVIAHSTTAEDNLVGVFYFESYARYFAPVVYNVDTVDDLKSVSDAHTITIYPVAWQAQ